MRRLLFAAVLVVLSACSRGTAGETLSIAVRDSAGIEIVEHPAGYEAQLPEWRVDSVPLVDIGGREEPGYDLHRVIGAVRLSDGRIVVANRSSGELRYFDGTGRHLSSSGRIGQGPGEFSEFGMTRPQRLAADTVLVIDTQFRRGSFFDPAGTLVKTVSTGTHDLEIQGVRSYLGVFAFLANGRFLAEHRAIPEMRETSGPARRDSFAVVTMDPSAPEAPDTVAVVPGEERYPALGHEGPYEFPTLRSVVFGRSSVVATDGHWIFVGTNDPDGIRVYDDRAALVRFIRTATPRERVTEAAQVRWREDQERSTNAARVSEAVKNDWRRMYANPRFAETFPLYQRLVPGSEGTLWIELVPSYIEDGSRFMIYDSTGRAVARVRMPRRVYLYQAGPDEVLGRWRDPDDVEHVRVYAVKREP